MFFSRLSPREGGPRPRFAGWGQHKIPPFEKFFGTNPIHGTILPNNGLQVIFMNNDRKKWQKRTHFAVQFKGELKR